MCIVLPSKRAATYLRKELSAKLNKPFWSPHFFTMQDLFAHFSDFEQLDPAQALFTLYEAYVEVKGNDADDLGTFLTWGPTLLKDINDVDNYLLDPIPFFTDLRNIKEIEDWSLGEEKLTKDQMRFAELWKEQGEIYRVFCTKTQKKGQGTYGAMGRNIASKIDTISESTEINKFWFVGLNALSKSETLLIKTLTRADKANCQWNADAYYFDNEVHEAGYFLRKNKHNSQDQSFDQVDDSFSTGPKDIEVLSASNDLSQVQIACNVLSELSEKKLLERTVVVLPDQQLLIPLLTNLPEEIDLFNITMGIPLKGTPALELLFSMISLHEKRARSGRSAFYYKDVESILKHPLLLKVLGSVSSNNTNKAYLEPVDILSNDRKEFGILQDYFESGHNVKGALNGIHQILKELAISNKLHAVEREFVIRAMELWERLIEIQEKTSLIQDIRTLQKLSQHLAREYDVTFIGEPLQGLQIMGVLETRAIDVDHVVYLSMNEGYMPQEDRSNTYIPYDLRKIYELPTRSERASVQAYNFYSSIQRAKTVHLIWKDEGASTKGGGKSRFIAQMDHELSGFPNIQFRKSTPTQNSVGKKNILLKVEKTKEVIELIKAHFERGLSPSAMSTYIQCPLDYYYKYVLGIRTKDNAMEHLDIPGLGTIVHESAEVLMKPFVSKKIDPVELRESKKKISETVEKAFRKHHPFASLDQGKDLLHFEIVKKFMNDYLSKEIERSQKHNIHLTSLEEGLNTLIELNVDGNEIAIRLIGKADRIDRTDDGVVLIDLKSGKVQYSDLSVRTMEDVIGRPKIKVLQLLTYAYMLQKQEPSIKTLKAGIFPFGNSASGLVLCKVDGSEDLGPEIFTHYEELLQNIVSSLLDTEQAFEHKEGNEYCEFCLKN